MAVYTSISEDSLSRHLTRFHIGTLVSFAGIVEGVENTNYKLVTTQGPFILTLFEKRTRAEDLPFFIAFMEYLHDHALPCPAVVAGNDGEKIMSLANKPALITTFLEGTWPRQSEDFHAAVVGKTLAQMHLAGKDFQLKRENSMSLPAWETLIGQCGKQPELQEELAFLGKNRPQGLPEGAVHADLFPDNVFFTGKKLTGVIDFYFSCTETFAYDLMLTLNAWCFDPAGILNVKKSAAFLEAYQAVRPLSASEKASLPFFGRATALRIIATRLYDLLHPDAGAVVKAKDPLEYVRILKFYQDGKFRI